MLRARGNDATKLLILVAMMLVTAGVIEGVLHRTIQNPEARLDCLRALYRAQREHLETQRLPGDRRENKFHTRGAPPRR